MSADPKARKGKKGGRKKNRQAKAPKAQAVTNTIFDSILNNVSLPTAAGIGVTVLALTASMVLLRAPKTSKNSKSKRKGLQTPGNLRFAKSAPTLAGLTPGGPSGGGAAGGKKEVTIEIVSKMFQSCLQSRGKDQKMLMDEFYKRIRSWNHDMLDTPAQTIVVNFLFWYFRMSNAPKTTFDSEQADYIRYWADYELTDKLEYSIYNLKFDFMYSLALLQRSIPHMKRFWRFVTSTQPREPPKIEYNNSMQMQPRKKNNYQLTRYQAACILGDWPEVKRIGLLIERATKDMAYLSPKDNYMLNYALRAMEMPQSNANFGQMYKIVEKLRHDFASEKMPPPKFGVWQVHSFKYRNMNGNATPTDDSKFVVASINMKDKDNWYHFYPPLSRMVSMARIPREVKLWGRIAQMMSPMNGLSGCLPMTGTWSDVELYMEMEWTYRVDSTHNRRKHGILQLERGPIEDSVKFTDVFGNEILRTGYKWTGTLKISVKDEEDRLAARMANGRMFSLSNGSAGDKAAREKRIRDLFGNRDKKEDVKTDSNETNTDTATATPTAATPKDDPNLPPPSTTVTIVKADEKSEENSEAVNDDNSGEEVAMYEVELIIETDVEDAGNKSNAGASASASANASVTSSKQTPRGNGPSSASASANAVNGGKIGAPSSPAIDDIKDRDSEGRVPMSNEEKLARLLASARQQQARAAADNPNGPTQTNP